MKWPHFAAHLLLAEFRKRVPVKPLSSRPFPATRPHPVADFVTMWAGYDNRNP